MMLMRHLANLLACGTPASFSVHLASSAVTPAGSVDKSRGDNEVRIWVQLKRCVLCMRVLQGGISGDGCDLASTLYRYDLRKGDFIVLLLPLVARCLETIYVCELGSAFGGTHVGVSQLRIP